jgi:hypothetical protein
MLTKKKGKKGKKHFCEHCTHANPTANLTAQSPSQRGLREYKRSAKPKKAPFFNQTKGKKLKSILSNET